MAFIEFANSLINTAVIREVNVRPAGDDYETLVWVEGSSEPRKERGNKLYEIQRVLCPVVSASPGWEVLWYWPQEDGSDLVTREPVIAWRIDSSVSGVEPITADWDSNNDIEGALDVRPNRIIHYLKKPDGTVNRPGFEEWRDEDTWLADMRGGNTTKTVQMFQIPARNSDAS